VTTNNYHSLSFKFNIIVCRCLVVRRRTFHFPSQSYITTNGQSVSLYWCQSLYLGQEQIIVTAIQLRVCWWEAPFLMRGQICRLKLLLVLASAFILGPESRETHDDILPSQILELRNLENQVPLFISFWNRGPSYTPRHCVSFSPSRTQKASLEVFEEVEVEVNLRPIVSRPVYLGVRRPSGTRDQFFFLLEISFRQLRLCYFVAPSLTRGQVCNLLYNCFWAFPEQSLLGRSPAELTAIFYCLIWDSPNLEGQVPVFLSPKNKVAELYFVEPSGFPFCRLLRLAGLR
jgi:hypothetical protein